MGRKRIHFEQLSVDVRLFRNKKTIAKKTILLDLATPQKFDEIVEELQQHAKQENHEQPVQETE